VGHLPPDRRARGPAHDPELAVRRVGALLGRRRLHGGDDREFRDALADAERAPTFALIETRVGFHDLSPVSKKYIRASARKGRIRAVGA